MASQAEFYAHVIALLQERAAALAEGVVPPADADVSREQHQVKTALRTFRRRLRRTEELLPVAPRGR